MLQICKTLLTTPRQDLKLLKEELKENVPEPLHSMLEETKEEAIEKHKTRKQKETVICGPTYTGELRAGWCYSKNSNINIVQ